MRTEVVMESEDFEVWENDELYLTFYDTDKTGSRIQVKIPEWVIKKFKEEIKKLM